jgi:hypothetical protein
MRAKNSGIVGVMGPATSGGFATVRALLINCASVIFTTRTTGADLIAKAA